MLHPTTLKISLSQVFNNLENNNMLTVINSEAIRDRFNTPTSFLRTTPVRVLEDVLIGLTQNAMHDLGDYRVNDHDGCGFISTYSPEFYRLGEVVLCRQWLYTDNLPECTTHMTFRFNLDNDSITVWFEPKYLDLPNNLELDDFERTLKNLNLQAEWLDVEQPKDLTKSRRSKYAGYTTKAYPHIPTIIIKLSP